MQQCVHGLLDTMYVMIPFPDACQIDVLVRVPRSFSYCVQIHAVCAV